MGWLGLGVDRRSGVACHAASAVGTAPDRRSTPGWEKAEEGSTTQLVFVLPYSDTFHILAQSLCLRNRRLLKKLVLFVYILRRTCLGHGRDDGCGKAGRQPWHARVLLFVN